MDNRSDITQAEVFISWTGKDAGLKEHIVKLLKNAGISCKESNESCSGDYRQWSREAVGACEILLLVLTENAFTSKYIPMELDALEGVAGPEDFKNRIVPVCTSQALYRSYPRKLHAYASAVFRDALTPEEADAAILQKVTDLLVNRMQKIYRKASAPDYMRLAPLYSAIRTPDRSYSFRDLYIPRTLTEVDARDQEIAVFDSPAPLLTENDIFFIHGPGGSGKTQYINQIREGAPEDILVFSLSCARLAASDKPLFEHLYLEFDRLCGNRVYNSRATFRRLLSIRRIVLVLDGMDEISSQDGTRSFLRKIEEYFVPNKTLTTLVFTSRNRDDADLIAMAGKTARRFRLKALHEDQIRQLGENLFLLFGSREKCTDFYVSTQSLSQEIRSNPLLLSQLAIVYQDSGRLPDTLVGIWDAIADITFRQDRQQDQIRIRAEYEDMVRRRLPGILKEFSRERYRLLSAGKKKDLQKILSAVLKKTYPDDSRERAEYLMEYLQNRAIVVDGEFYHKMFLEYFTAVYYYEHAFDDYDEIEDPAMIEELFSHYADPFWTQVLQLFLMKADSQIDEDTSGALYETVLEDGSIQEYTLLFDAAAHLARHANLVQRQLVTDILQKSTDGTYSAYGPLFWYVPEFGVYEAAVLAARDLGTAEALALTRDVCVIFGHFDTLSQVTDRVDGRALYDAVKADLSGVRDALCWLFCTGTADLSRGTDIYPRCFNTAEAAAFLETGCGVRGRMDVPFVDELGLYRHLDHPRLAGEFIGILSCPYDKTAIERKLSGKPTRKLRGLILTPTADTTLDFVSFDRSEVRVFFPPENITKMAKHCRRFMPLQEDFTLDIRFRDHLVLSGMEAVPDYYLSNSTVLKSAELAEGIDSIGKKAFWGCENLARISLPGSLKTIGDRAFFWCGSLKTLHLPQGVTHIGPKAFSCCKALEEVVIPGSVERIDDEAFRDCGNLRRVILEEGVKSIGELAFADCKNLREIRLPDSVMELGDEAFSSCAALEEVRLPEKLEILPQGLFAFCASLREIHIPDSVTEADGYVFQHCFGLRRVRLSPGLTEIPRGMFIDCSIEAIEIPAGVTYIGGSAFENCAALQGVTFPQELRRISNSAFSGCTALTEVQLPDSVNRVGSNCFAGCAALERVRLPNSLKRIESHAFSDCASLRRIHIPQGVKEIEFGVFSGCTGLVDIRLPDSLRVISIGAFQDCRGLPAIDLPSRLQEICLNAFENCASLNDVVLPESLLRLGEFIFGGCTSLTRLTVPHRFRHHSFGTDVVPTVTAQPSIENVLHIPEGVTRLSAGTYAQRMDLTEVVLPSSVEILDGYAFADCQNLRRVCFAPGLKSIGTHCFRSCISLEEVTIPDGVTEIDDNAFVGCVSLRRVWLPDSVRHIGPHAFSRCSALTALRLPAGLEILETGTLHGCSSLAELQLPLSLKEIRSEAFSSCFALTRIDIPDGVHTIGGECFWGCVNLEEIILPKALTELSSGLFSYCDSLKSITLPPALTTIGEEAFAGCSGPERIVIPEGVTRIGASAFKDCTSLTEIHIPDSVTQFGCPTSHGQFDRGAVFYGCSALTHVRLPKMLSQIPDHTFEGCASLTRLELPAAVTEIGSKAFFDCAALRAIALPQGLTAISVSAFSDCAALEGLALPDSVTEIGTACFSGCTDLREVTLSSNLTEIPSYAFDGCTALGSVTFPEGITTVYHDAFRHCTALEEIVIPVSVMDIGEDAFLGCRLLRSVTISSNFRSEIPRIFGDIDPAAIHFI